MKFCTRILFLIASVVLGAAIVNLVGCQTTTTPTGQTVVTPTPATTQAVTNVGAGAAEVQSIVSAAAAFLPPPASSIASVVSAIAGGVSVVSAALLAYFGHATNASTLTAIASSANSTGTATSKAS
jgi:hypothetical protein